MANEIVSYMEMCSREGVSLQRGMNFFPERDHSVILMSVQPNAPYRDRIEDDGEILIYEGHDAPKSKESPDPKLLDQPGTTGSGNLTANGVFYQAAAEYSRGDKHARVVRVYEKLKKGIWSYNGPFALVGAWQEHDGDRTVYKFRLSALQTEHTTDVAEPSLSHRRVIPSSVKLAVWKRDGGECVRCGATDELHFDHVLPYSRGGTSLRAENVQLLCARHNLSKSNKIE